MKKLLLSVYDSCCEQSSMEINDGNYSEIKSRDFDWDDICFLTCSKENRDSYPYSDEEIKLYLNKFSEYDEIILCEDGEITIIRKEDLW